MIKRESLESFENSLQNIAANQGIPLIGGFELTSRCNLTCKMCYVRNNAADRSKELSAKQWIRLGQEAVDQGTLIAFLTGGEPLLRDDFREIYEAFSRLGVRLTLFTNASLMTDEFIRWLSSNPPACVDVTVYGASEDTYQNLCGSREAYKKVMRNIDLLLQHGMRVRIKSTIVRSNMHDFGKIKAFAEERSLQFLYTNEISGHKAFGMSGCLKERLTPDEVLAYTIPDKPDDCGLDQIEFDNLKTAYRNIPAMYCMATKNSYFVNWKGQLTPCALFVTHFTEPLETGFKAAWDQLRNKVNDIPAPAACGDCEKRAFCSICPARCYLETGAYDKTAEYFCSIAELRKAFAAKSVKAITA